MRSITGSLTPAIEAHIGNQPIAKAEAFPVHSYRELAEHVAQLSYLNKDHLLFYRGQSHDFRNKANSTTVYPTIYRGERVTQEQLDLSFSVLESASARLCDILEEERLSSHRDVRRRKFIQWSILQHYEVCATPLLDLTHSLRVACSFAFLGADQGAPYVYAFGLPYVTNRISINSEHDLVNIRLISICPPEALRPHFQEGYLAGTDEVLMDYDSKSELDFNNRLIAKFRLEGGLDRFFREGFKPYPKRVLYPPEDRVKELCSELSLDLTTGVSAGRVGAFLERWTMLEALVMAAARDAAPKTKTYSMRAAVDILASSRSIGAEVAERLHRLRVTRNEVVHRPDRVAPADLAGATEELRHLLEVLREPPP